MEGIIDDAARGGVGGGGEGCNDGVGAGGGGCMKKFVTGSSIFNAGDCDDSGHSAAAVGASSPCPIISEKSRSSSSKSSAEGGGGRLWMKSWWRVETIRIRVPPIPHIPRTTFLMHPGVGSHHLVK